MTDALEGAAPPKPSLRDDANAQRIGRARFLGHAIGYTLLVLAIETGLTFAGFKELRPGPDGSAATVPSRWILLIGSLLLMAALLDLAVRRRHDRNRSGLDCVLALLALEAIAVTALFGLLQGGAAIGELIVSAALGLYLIVVLAIVPGNKGQNRYGAPPRQH